MIDFLDVLERVNKGDKMDEKEFDLLYFKKTNEILKHFPKIRCPEESNIINFDDEMSDMVFEAGIKLLLETGTYCINSKTIIKWSEEEIWSCLKSINSEVVFGEGIDQRRFIKRSIEDFRLPGICPGFHAPYTEDIVPELIKTIAMIPQADIVEGCNFPTIEGHQIYGLPFEVYAQKRQIEWFREGIRKAGRPGMGILAYPISPKAATLASILNPECGIRHTDGITLNPLNGQKIEYEYLAAAIIAREYGCNIVGGGLPAGIGSYSGGPEGAAIGAVAAQINGLLAYRANFGSMGIYCIWPSKEREALWAMDISIQAINRNTRLNLLQYITHYAGPCTEMCLQEIAAKTIILTVNGSHLALHTCTTAVPRWNNVQTPVEALWMINVANAVVGSKLKREDANKIVNVLFMKYKDKLNNPPRGKGVLECFNLYSKQLAPEYKEVWNKVAKELTDLGMKIDKYYL
ncbi:MAG: monomethylamine:corrinoid methyltransferase [Nitrososphaeria archaeon]